MTFNVAFTKSSNSFLNVSYKVLCRGTPFFIKNVKFPSQAIPLNTYNSLPFQCMDLYLKSKCCSF